MDIGFWSSYTIDFRGNIISYKNLTGYWYEYTRDISGKVIRYKDSKGKGKDISYE